ncbi:dihydrofolate reductase [Litoribrevibacter euphylliae]|uniref:Dihydrofolate reductase n=1 Tax=Litoribrevibacter euphylliae TaxID=1834034 RepID=A0ABV7HLA3_9GAMM
MKLSMIVAMAENRVIGRDNKLPWYLPEDLKYFKKVTMGKPIIMGRKTYESIGRPLPGRPNIVLSRSGFEAPEGVHVVSTIEQAKELAESLAVINGYEEAMIIGGAQIYGMAFDQCDRFYLTQVHADVEGDAYFPEFDRSTWQEIGREEFKADGPNPYDYSFIVLERVV